MNKYKDYIAYPIMLAVIYVLLGLLNWDRDPGTWSWNMRCFWLVWTVIWGIMLQIRIRTVQEFT